MSKPEILSRRTLSFSRLAIDDSMRLYSERLDDWIFESSDTLLVPRYNRVPETLVLAPPPPPLYRNFRYSIRQIIKGFDNWVIQKYNALTPWRSMMGKAKVVDGIKLSILVPAGDLKRLKFEAIERGMLESSIVLEALRLHWAHGTSVTAEPVPLLVAPIPAQTDFLPTQPEPIPAAAVPAQAEPTLAQLSPLVAGTLSALPEDIPVQRPIPNEQAAAVEIPPSSSSTPGTPGHSDAVPQPAPAPETPAKSKPAKAAKTKREDGDRELYQAIKAAVDAKRISWPEVVKQVAPGCNLSIYRSSWAISKWIPAKYVQAMREVLDGLEAEVDQPAGDSQVSITGTSGPAAINTKRSTATQPGSPSPRLDE